MNVVIPLFNKEDSISATLESVLSQLPPSHARINIIVVNDASTDNSLQITQRFTESYPQIEVIDLAINSGRSKACNMGVFHRKSDYSIIIDADCTWESPNILQRYIQLFKSNKTLVLGYLSGRPNTFWGDYYNKLNRKRAFSSLLLEQATTANFGCKTEYLKKIGGFSTLYQRYGFEDRDLFLTLSKIPIPPDEIVFDRDIIALNNDTPTLNELSIKLMTAGQYTSLIFYSRHPNEYRRSQYYPFDVRHKGRATVRVVTYAAPVIRLLLKISIKLFYMPLMPKTVKSFLVKVCTALSFTLGTLRS